MKSKATFLLTPINMLNRDFPLVPIVILAVIATAVIAGYGVYLWQVSDKNQQIADAIERVTAENSAKIVDLQNQLLAKTLAGSVNPEVSKPALPETPAVSVPTALFIGEAGYTFDYPTTWSAAANKANPDNALFGPGATGSSGLGGVEFYEKGYSSAADFLDRLIKDTAITVTGREMAKSSLGYSLLKYQYSAMGKLVGQGVIYFAETQKEIYSLYLNSLTATDSKNFEIIVNSFKLK
jgi:hypothetical protein